MHSVQRPIHSLCSPCCREGKHFGRVLNFLRDGAAVLPASDEDCKELQAEAEFYNLTGLAAAIDEGLEAADRRRLEAAQAAAQCAAAEQRQLEAERAAAERVAAERRRLEAARDAEERGAADRRQLEAQREAAMRSAVSHSFMSSWKSKLQSVANDLVYLQRVLGPEPRLQLHSLRLKALELELTGELAPKKL